MKGGPICQQAWCHNPGLFINALFQLVADVGMTSPLLDRHLGLLERVEDFAVEQLVSELAIEALVEAVLPGAAGLRR